MVDEQTERTSPAARVPVAAARASVAAALTAPAAPRPPVRGEAVDDRPPAAGGDTAGGWPPARLSAGGHQAPIEQLVQLALPGGRAGLFLGRDRSGQPVTIRPFQRDAVRLALIGGLWSARVLVFRALALGARIVVHTERPGDWRGFGAWAVGRDDRLTVLENPQPVTVPASVSTPVLTVYDFGAHGGPATANLGPWHAELTVLSHVNAVGFMAVERADLMLAQRLTPTEAYAAQSVRRFGDPTVDMLQRLADDMLGVVGEGSDSYLWTTPSRVELEAFGPPQR